MKKVISLFIVLALMFCITACGKTNPVKMEKSAEPTQSTMPLYQYNSEEKYERMNVAIDFEGIFVDTFADVTIDYYDNEIACIDIQNPTVLAFDTTKAEKSGLAVISGDTVNDTLYILDKLKSKMDNDSDIAEIEELIDKYSSTVIYGYCPT